MKVILMAAGMGTRISKHIGEIPKSLVDIGNGTTLISHTIEMLQSNNITDISVIVGYKHDLLEKELQSKNVKIYHNDIYSSTNSIYSLFLAKEELCNEDIILANADVFWESNILQLLTKTTQDIVMLSDASRADSGDYFFYTDSKNNITAYGKTLTRENRTCEYVGIAKIKKSFIPQFKERLVNMIDDGLVNKWWEEILYSFVGDKNIVSCDVDNKFWAEVDTIEDYNRIKSYVLSKTSQKNTLL